MKTRICPDEIPGPGDLRDIRDDGLPGLYDDEYLDSPDADADWAEECARTDPL